MKILYFADLHLKGKNPENRIGNYYQDIISKLKETVSIAQKNKCNIILSGGDNLDSPLISLPICDEFIDIIEEGKIPFYTVWGNHEEEGHNFSLSKSTTLNHMFNRSLLIKLLTEIEKKNCYIKGYSYYHNIEGDIKEKGLYCEDKTDKWKIAIVHALVTLKPLPYQCMHVVMKDIKTNFDVVLVAHNHQQWGVKEINGTKFINVGCLGRRKIDEKDIKPSCLLIDTETKKLKIIELKSAKLVKEIFDLKKVEEIKQFEGEINNFINSLSDVKIQGLDIRGMVEYISKEKKVEQKIIDEVITRIGGFEK